MDSQNSSVVQFITLDNQIKDLIDQIDTLKEELKNQKEMQEDTFQNDPVYQEHDKKVKEASRIRLATKSQITKQSRVAEMEEKIEEERDDIKRMEATLSELVIQYQKETGATQIETSKGEVLSIVNKVKLIKIKSLETS